MEIRLASIHTNVLSTNFVCDSQTDIISIYFNSLNDFISYGRKNILIFIKSDFITDIIFYMGIHLYDFAKTTRTIILMGSLMLPIKFDYNTKIEVTVSPSRRNISGTMVPISRELFPTHTGHPISSWRPPMHTGHLGPTWRPPMNTGHPAPTWRPPMHTGHFPVKSVGDNKKD